MAGLGLGGCKSTTVLAFDDHPAHPLTTMQAFEVKSFLFWATGEHKFFLCDDKGESLECKRVCGGTNDIACPQAVSAYGGGSSNVR
jgi:hypothetical protein